MGSAKVEVPLNLAPTCASATVNGCHSISAPTGTFPSATFTSTADGFASPQGDSVSGSSLQRSCWHHPRDASAIRSD